LDALSEQILQTQNLTKRYGHFSAVNNLSISLQKGDIYGLVGKNGAGKTTLLKMISGLTVPASGEIELFGQTSESGLTRARSRTGCMIESSCFFPYLSATQNLEFYRIQEGISGEKVVEEALRFVALADTGKKKFKNFSMGMKQRLGLAFAIMGKPDLLILDEPINGLDPMGIAEFRDIICKLNREYNTTILISSHILGELSQIATVYGFINQGNLVEQVSAKELTEKCRRRLVVKVDDTAKTAGILKDELSCTEYEIEDGRLFIEKYMDTPEVLNEVLVKNGVKVSELITSGLSLEQYFIDLVGGKQNA
jgi:ABC-2 type transport system ATP-binding protein